MMMYMARCCVAMLILVILYPLAVLLRTGIELMLMAWALILRAEIKLYESMQMQEKSEKTSIEP